MSLRIACATTLAVTLVGCKGPPEAPKKLERLAAYMFDKTRDGTDEELSAGIENLGAWLDKGYADAHEGYQIDKLSQASVNALDSRDFNMNGLVGVSVASRINHKIKPVIAVLADGDATEVYGDTYVEYNRTWATDADCHTDRECLWGEASVTSLADYGLVKVESSYRAEFRWVETPRGWAHLHRTWLVEPIDVLGVRTQSQFYIGVSMDDGNRTERFQASWVAYQTDLPLSEDTAMNQTISRLLDAEDEIDVWLD